MFRRTWQSFRYSIAAAFLLTAAASWAVQEWKQGIDWIEPPLVDPGPAPSQPAQPPSDAIVLFDGKELSAWEGAQDWKIQDGYAIDGGNIASRQSFGDCQLHLEFASPEKVEGESQGRGNSGIYFMGRYEVQILDSWKNLTYYDGQCASIYKQHPPLVNASRPPGQWQTYDIVFQTPRFRPNGTLKTPGYVTVLHNGVLVQNHYELLGGTSWDSPPEYTPHAEREPLKIQFHGNPVRFRNIWLRDLKLD